MERTVQLLVVGADPLLSQEVESALGALPGWRMIPHYARRSAEALEIAVSRQPQFVLLDLSPDTGDPVALAWELHRALPGVAVAAMYRREARGGEEPESELIIELARARVQDFLRRPLAGTELRDLIERVMRPQAGQSSHGKVAVFLSNKGGVGKSTLSVNTACELARRHPGRVLLIDLSLQLGICAMMLGILPATTTVDAVRERDRLDETLLRQMAQEHDSGLQLLAAPMDALAASEVDDQAVSRIINLARRAYDYVIVDTFPMLDGVVMASLDLADCGFVVLQGTTPCIVGTAKLLPVLDTIGFPRERIRVVLNENYRNFTGNLLLGDIEARLGRPIDYAVPYDRGVLTSMNTGQPRALSALRWFGFGRAIRGLADEIEQLSPGPGVTGETGASTASPPPLVRKASA